MSAKKCHFAPPPPPLKWNVCRFGTFKSSWTTDFKVPSSPRNERFADLEVSRQVGQHISKYHLTPPPPQSEKLAGLEFSNQIGLQISKCHFTPPPPLKGEKLAFLVKFGLQEFRFEKVPLELVEPFDYISKV